VRRPPFPPVLALAAPNAGITQRLPLPTGVSLGEDYPARWRISNVAVEATPRRADAGEPHGLFRFCPGRPNCGPLPCSRFPSERPHLRPPAVVRSTAKHELDDAILYSLYHHWIN
jgi:hypothetical protein